MTKKLIDLRISYINSQEDVRKYLMDITVLYIVIAVVSMLVHQENTESLEP